MENNGIIIKGIGGIYTISGEDGRLFSAKPRGIFRKNNVKPMIGDHVIFEKCDGDETAQYLISEILPRKNELIRPTVANVDSAVLVIAALNPRPDLMLTDKLIAVCISKGIKPILIVNKEDQDIHAAQALKDQYVACCDGNSFTASLFGENNKDETERFSTKLKKILPKGVTVLSGQSGVGKSTFINLLLNNKIMETGELSRKLERGKHTTRHSEMFPIGDGKYVIDSPGFSLFDAIDFESQDLKNNYPEFNTGECRFPDCSHTGEPNCKVTELLKSGILHEERYERYKEFYKELKEKEKRKYK